MSTDLRTLARQALDPPENFPDYDPDPVTVIENVLRRVQRETLDQVEDGLIMLSDEYVPAGPFQSGPYEGVMIALTHVKGIRLSIEGK